MRRLKKNYFISLFWVVVGLLGLVRISRESTTTSSHTNSEENHAQTEEVLPLTHTELEQDKTTSVPTKSRNTKQKKRLHPIYSVPSFSRTFPDQQDTHIISARKWGVTPVKNRASAEHRKNELVYIGSNPYYKIDPGMSSSTPFLVPHAAKVLETIARNYLDSLHVKGIPLHKILISSVLRTEEDIERLRKVNVNASPESCHRYGTTFDIPYNRYHTISPPDQTRRTVQNDTLKWILAEVLRDARENGLCHIKYEIKQGCFHITAK